MKLLFGFIVCLSIFMCAHTFVHKRPVVSVRGTHWNLDISTKGINPYAINLTFSL
jgi:hypothetical protein